MPVRFLSEAQREHLSTFPAERDPAPPVTKAVAWYARSGRIVVGRDRDGAIDAVVAGWAGDVAQGHQSAMNAWRRADVAELNRRARQEWRRLGRLQGEDLVAPGGTPYAVGDRVVTLAPGAGGKTVTSETGTVIVANREAKTVAVRMDDDRDVHILEGGEIGADRLAHAYAVTVHRSQGSTVQRAHALEDGGGRELAYVKMSRAKERSTVYVVADSVEQATDDLNREWSAERRPAWVIDSATPVTDPAAVEIHPRVAAPMRAALRRARLVAERDAIRAVTPPDPSAAIQAAELEQRRLQRQRNDLAAGTGRYAGGPIAGALWTLQRAEANVARLESNLERPKQPRKDRRGWRAELGEWREKLSAAVAEVESLRRPEVTRLERPRSASPSASSGCVTNETCARPGTTATRSRPAPGVPHERD